LDDPAITTTRNNEDTIDLIVVLLFMSFSFEILPLAISPRFRGTLVYISVCSISALYKAKKVEIEFLSQLLGF
jgi:hypothetical protein